MLPDDPRIDTLPKVVLRNGREIGGTVAMRRKSLGIWQRLTWSEVSRQMLRIAAGLAQQGLAADACLAVIGDNEPELFWAEYAIQATGRAAVCLYPDLSAAEIAPMLKDCGARTVFAEDQEQCDKLLEVAAEIGLRAIICWDPRGLAGYDARVLSLDALCGHGDRHLAAHPGRVEETIARGRAEDLAVVIYTSGTTGDAKGVMGSHRYLMDCADRWASVLEAEAGADYVSYISPAWATEQYLGLALGSTLPMIVNFPEEPETVAIDTREIGARFLFFSPRQWEAIVASTEGRIRDAHPVARAVYRWGMRVLAEEPAGARGRVRRALADLLVGRPVRDRLGFSNLHTAVNSGSSLSPEVYAFFQALGVSLRNVYGFTEIGIVTATRGDRSTTAGRLLASRYGAAPLEVRIDAHEIQVRGGVIFDGYYGRPDLLAARRTPDGWMRSGDAGFFDDGGDLVYLDRLDDLRRLADGSTFAPQFVEARVRLSPYIRDAMVVGDAARPYAAALVDIDVELVGRWAEERRISFVQHADLSQHPEVYRLVESELDIVNASLPERSRIVRFANLFKPLDADEGELTRSRKLRRNVVEAKYGTLVEALYQPAPQVGCSIEARFRDGRTRILTAEVRIWTVAAMAERARIDAAPAPAPRPAIPTAALGVS